MSRNFEKGRSGEQRAAALLAAAGYRIVRRNLQLPGGEIDLLCADGPTVVFVEVKARWSRSFGSALSGVNARKRARLRKVAEEYAQIVAPAAPIRFDVVALDGDRMTLHKNAF